MIGDVIIIKNTHKKKANTIFKNIKGLDFNNKKIICIGGESGTGKTEIAHVLRDLAYGGFIKTQIISLDDYYITLWSARNNIRINKGIKSVGKHEMQWNLINGIIDSFKSITEPTIRLKKINRYTDSIEYSIFEREDVDLLIIEGLYSCFCKNVDFKVYLDGSVSDTKDFRFMRKKEAQNKFRIKVLKKEHNEVIKSKKLSDLIISFDGKKI